MIMQFNTSGTLQILAANTISNTDKFAKVVHPDIGGYPTNGGTSISVMLLQKLWFYIKCGNANPLEKLTDVWTILTNVYSLFL